MTRPRPQVPGAGEVVLDHVGLLTADMDAAASAMARLGFRLTPFTPQRHALGPGAPVVPAGTGNRLAMLRPGYLEALAARRSSTKSRSMHAPAPQPVGRGLEQHPIRRDRRLVIPPG